MSGRALLAGLALAVVPLANSCSAPNADREGPNGAQPDQYQDMTRVTVYRAPDQVPNIATGCIGGYGFMTTLKNTDGGSSSSGAAAPSLVRLPELDKLCAA